MRSFPTTARETRDLALLLIAHLRENLKDTHGQTEWTTRNLDALRSFRPDGYELLHLPPAGSNQKGAFLWDYIAYQQDSGILIAAESEHSSKPNALKEDFDKLLYVRSPIKVMFFWLPQQSLQIKETVASLSEFMRSCDQYSPAEIFVLYCRTWQNADGTNGDRAWWLQVDGEPSHRGLHGKAFEPVSS